MENGPLSILFSVPILNIHSTLCQRLLTSTKCLSLVRSPHVRKRGVDPTEDKISKVVLIQKATCYDTP